MKDKGIILLVSKDIAVRSLNDRIKSTDFIQTQ